MAKRTLTPPPPNSAELLRMRSAELGERSQSVNNAMLTAAAQLEKVNNDTDSMIGEIDVTVAQLTSIKDELVKRKETNLAMIERTRAVLG